MCEHRFFVGKWMYDFCLYCGVHVQELVDAMDDTQEFEAVTDVDAD